MNLLSNCENNYHKVTIVFELYCSPPLLMTENLLEIVEENDRRESGDGDEEDKSGDDPKIPIRKWTGSRSQTLTDRSIWNWRMKVMTTRRGKLSRRSWCMTGLMVRLSRSLMEDLERYIMGSLGLGIRVMAIIMTIDKIWDAPVDKKGISILISHVSTVFVVRNTNFLVVESRITSNISIVDIVVFIGKIDFIVFKSRIASTNRTVDNGCINMFQRASIIGGRPISCTIHRVKTFRRSFCHDHCSICYCFGSNGNVIQSRSYWMSLIRTQITSRTMETILVITKSLHRVNNLSGCKVSKMKVLTGHLHQLALRCGLVGSAEKTESWCMCMCAQDGFGMSPRIKCHQDIDMYMGVEIVMIKMKVKIRRVMEEFEVRLVKIREDMEESRVILVKEVMEDMRSDMRSDMFWDKRMDMNSDM